MKPRSLFLAPHNDDETLFGAFTLIAWKPDVIVCFRSAKQSRSGIEPQRREMETGLALQILEGERGFMQSAVLDTATDREALGPLTEMLTDAHEIFPESDRPYDLVFAPAVEEGGHEQHSFVGQLALDVFGPDRVVPYLTYRRGFGRSTSSVEVPFLPEWPARKLAAMSFYRSQIALPSTAPWFVDYGLREFYAEGTKAVLLEGAGAIPLLEDALAPDENMLWRMM